MDYFVMWCLACEKKIEHNGLYCSPDCLRRDLFKQIVASAETYSLASDSSNYNHHLGTDRNTPKATPASSSVPFPIAPPQLVTQSASPLRSAQQHQQQQQQKLPSLAPLPFLLHPEPQGPHQGKVAPPSPRQPSPFVFTSPSFTFSANPPSNAATPALSPLPSPMTPIPPSPPPSHSAATILVAGAAPPQPTGLGIVVGSPTLSSPLVRPMAAPPLQQQHQQQQPHQYIYQPAFPTVATSSAALSATTMAFPTLLNRSRRGVARSPVLAG